MAAHLSPTFRARILEMEENRRILLHRLQKEKEIHHAKKSELSKQDKVLSKIRRRCLSLKQKEAELYLKVSEKDEELKIVNQTISKVTLEQRTLSSDLRELQHRQRERLEFYKQKRDMMDGHKIRLQDYVRNLKAETNGLREAVLQLHTRAKDIQKKSSILVGLVDGNIQNEEKIKVSLSRQLDDNDNDDAFEARIPYCNMKAELDNRINIARRELEQAKKSLEDQRMELTALQMENQSLENQVIEAIQHREKEKD